MNNKFWDKPTIAFAIIVFIVMFAAFSGYQKKEERVDQHCVHIKGTYAKTPHGMAKVYKCDDEY